MVAMPKFLQLLWWLRLTTIFQQNLELNSLLSENQTLQQGIWKIKRLNTWVLLELRTMSIYKARRRLLVLEHQLFLRLLRIFKIAKRNQNNNQSNLHLQRRLCSQQAMLLLSNAQKHKSRRSLRLMDRLEKSIWPKMMTKLYLKYSSLTGSLRALSRKWVDYKVRCRD